MDSVKERVRELVSSLPEGASVTLPRRVLASWVEDADEGAQTAGEGRRDEVADLTVGELADALEQAPSTVRGWMPDVPGAYKLAGAWRVSREDWRAYLDGLADDGDDGANEVRSSRGAELGDWRDEREGAA